ncbi:hypothetical protein AOR_1_520144 [Paecilomyces variotii No. 5]|uniref:Uncharacterized protein n=1 Tax=Byssochlamys spectabilis (strain No. 5 / NBRC 109023) TaxID=1356009 RepID=V5FCK9_BYSSN|nr:hypothetical protein AOR_1_520144 [Paecilomyces variotii No. 5]
MADANSSVSSATFRNSSALPFESQLSEQLWQRKEQGDTGTQPVQDGESSSRLGPPMRRSTMSRSLSDAAQNTVSVQSGPAEVTRTTKDDSAVSSNPATPQKVHPPSHGLTLNLPPRAFASPGSGPAVNRAPLSPKLDSSQIYGSPGSVLPRRSRGLDFSRACTNLHHSTLAEASPDSSPTIGGRGMTIPQRRGTATSSGIGEFSTSGPAERTTISSSVSSVNMLDSDTTSSDDDDDDLMNGDRDEMMITATPQASKTGGGTNPFAPSAIQSPGNDWMGGPPATGSFLSFQRARLRSRKSRHSSSSASGNSSKPSPGPLSPPVIKSIEMPSGGYFSRDRSRSALQSRRESLSLGTRDLHLSDLSDDGESRATRGSSPAAASNTEGGPLGVIRRAVTRRGNLLPKTKTFARIRAALMEEGAPIDSEAKREAEVIRQVRESDPAISETSPVFPSLDSAALASDADDGPDASTDGALPSNSFSNHAMKNSGGTEFWNSFDERYRTPPPPLRAAGLPGEDMTMETPPSTIFGSASTDIPRPLDRPQSGSSNAQVSQPAVAELPRKRRRDDDLDPNSFKRRAVSPGMSVQSSPILPQSPIVKETTFWGPPPKSLPGALGSENGSNSSGHSGPVKRVGLQGMNETNDGLMNMSIE